MKCGQTMEPEIWRRAEELFHAALERSPDARGAFLDEACGEETELRQQVEMLVSKDEQAGSFLENPVLTDVSAALATRGSLAGRQLGTYRILSLLGAGGMGEVYRAYDSKLCRDVAIKTLPPEFARDPERLWRLRHEAHTLASLNHPNIAAIYGLEESAEADYLVLELVEGDTLHGPLPVAAAVDLARQVAEALEAAHEHGIIHRDLKPSNVKVTTQGRVKVLDFGVAKAIGGKDFSEPAAATVSAAFADHLVGTPGYMSPEQARGAGVDQRTDIWAFGCLLYELLAGRRAFSGGTAADAIRSVLEDEPDWQALPSGTPRRVRQLLRQCLQKDTNRRLADIADVRATLEEAKRSRNRWRFLSSVAGRRRFALPAAALLLLLGFLGVRLYLQNARVRWVREQVIPEISRLRDSGDLKAVFRLMRRAEAVLPNDPMLRQIHQSYSLATPFSTDTPGAEVWATGYSPEDDQWVRLGTTPFTTKELPWGIYRFRIVKPGFRSILGTGEVRGGTSLKFDLDAEGAIPPEMVRVPAGTAVILGLRAVKLSAFLIDRYEVTNRQFKEFMDRGGYRKQEYWKQEFAHGRRLSWAEAMELFRDTTGRPGPSTWKLGEYPPGQDDYPVNGVSWYEAAAYAEFAGKQLPTIYHWQQAASPGWFADILGLSNFSGTGPAPVGSYKGLGSFGTLDMAGNVKEWCWNASGAQRYIRGGAWNEPAYMFSGLDARLPWDRSPENGIRCVRHEPHEKSGLEAPVTKPVRDLRQEKPAPEEVFRLYRSLYAYDATDLDARTEGIDEETSYWKREKVSFAAAYGNERVPGYFYIPKNATPPYQTILYAHAGMSLRLPSPQPAEDLLFAFLVKSGRAFLLPVLKGHYERRYATPPAGPNESRDRLILESKDFRRCVDYLVSRPDVDGGRLGVFGRSRGSCLLPILAVGEHRLKAAVLANAGLTLDPSVLPEDDPFHFVPRFQLPTLILGARSDFIFPLEASIRPMFRLLGAAEKDKRLFLRDGGHAPDAQSVRMMMKETLDWYDRYLGPVK